MKNPWFGAQLTGGKEKKKTTTLICGSAWFKDCKLEKLLPVVLHT